jgi:hypothetical protein
LLYVAEESGGEIAESGFSGVGGSALSAISNAQTEAGVEE